MATSRKRRISLKLAGRVLSVAGNKARQKKLSPERRREIAIIANQAREAKRAERRAAAKLPKAS